VAVLALLASVWGHLQSGEGRELLRQYVVGLLDRELAGQVEIGAIETLRLGHIELRGIRVLDPEGQQVAGARSASIHPDLPALAHGTIGLERVAADELAVHLRAGKGELPSLVDAFEAAGPAAPGDAEPTPVRIDSIVIERGSVSGPYVPLGISELRLEAELALRDALELGLARARFDVVQGSSAVGRVRSLQGHFSSAPGSRSEARIQLQSGSDRASVKGRWTMPAASSPGRVTARVHIPSLSPATLDRFGLHGPADPLARPIGARVRIHGPLDDLRATFALDTAGGDVDGTARVRGLHTLEVSLQTDRLRLEEVLAQMDPLKLSGQVHAHVTSLPESPRRIRVALDGVAVDETRIPSLRARATVHSDHLRIESLKLPYMRGQTRVRGRIGFDGASAVQVEASLPDVGDDPNVRRAAPSVRGRLRMDVTVRYAPARKQQLALDGKLSVRGLSSALMQAKRLVLKGKARGRAARPVVNVRIRGERLVVQDYKLTSLRARARGGPERYDVRLDVRAPERRRLRVRTRVQVGQDTLHATLRRLRLQAGRARWSGRGSLRIAHGHAITVPALALRSGRGRVTAQGQYRFDETVRASVDVAALDLARLPRFDFLPDVSGTVALNARIEGAVHRPAVQVDATWERGELDGVPLRNMQLKGRYDAQDRELAAEGQLALGGEYGGGRFRARAQFPRGPPMARATLLKGRYDTELELHHLDVSLPSRVHGDLPDLSGHVSGTTRLQGTVDQPELDVAIRGTDLAAPGYPALDARLSVHYEGERLQTHVTFDDQHGRLARFSAELESDLSRAVRAPDRWRRTLPEQPWELEAHVARRPLDEFPLLQEGPLSRLRGRIALQTRSGGRGPMEGDVTIVLDTAEPEGATGVGPPTCKSGARRRIALTAKLRGDRVEAEGAGWVQRKQFLELRANAAAPVDDWLAGRTDMEVPVLDARMRVANADLAHLPLLCAMGQGHLSAEARVDGLFGRTPRARLEFSSTDLVLDGQPRIRFEGNARISSDALVASVEAERFGGQGIFADATIPMRWQPGAVTPEVLTGGTLQWSVRFVRAPLELVLAPVPEVDGLAGTLHGELQARGEWPGLRYQGVLAVKGGGVELTPTGQEYQDVHGQLTFAERRIRIDRFAARAGSGNIRLQGEVRMPSPGTLQADLEAQTDDFAVRNRGFVVARLSSKTDVKARIGPQQGDVYVRVREMRVKLPKSRPPDVQSLEPHPDIVVLGKSKQAREQQARREAEAEDPYPLSIHIETARPFWVRRHDFAAQLHTSMALHSDPDFRITGSVQIRRGFYEMAGKRFELKRSTIRFTGGSPIDPVVRIVAVHRLDEPAGETLTVRVTGHVSDPQLNFASSVGPVPTAGDAVALLLGARGDDDTGAPETGDSLAGQTASFLGGVTAGLLTMTLREGLGKYAPNISIETGDGIGETKFRAGIDASQFVPKFMRDVVRSAYIEGFVGRSEQEGVSSTRAGVLMELQFPYNLLGTAALEPPTNWRVDLLWQP
jgi:translocation and assembly module TamB